jgi:hypothetical protein
LHPIERPRDGFVFDGSDRAQRDELVIRSANVNIFQLLRIQSIDAFDLRNHFVTAPFDVEPIDIIAANTSRDIGAYLLHVETERGDFIVIENDCRLGLIDLRINVAELENVGFHRFLEDLLRKFENAFLVRGRGDHEADRKIISPRERRRHDRKHLDAGNRAQFCLDLRQVGLGRRFANAPGL